MATSLYFYMAANRSSYGPSRRDNLDGSAPPEGVLRKCKLRRTPEPAPGSKKGGSLPSTSVFPVRHGESGNVAVTA